MTELPAGPTPQTGVGVVASFDFDRDRELWRWAPEDISLFMARTGPAPMTGNLEMVRALNDPGVLAEPARTVTALGSEVVLFACTACSFVGGAARETLLRQALLDAGAPRAVTTSGAAVEALREVGARRVAVVHPYSPDVGALLGDFLTAAGLDVTSSKRLEVPLTAVREVDYATVAELVRAGDHADADAVFVSCTALPTYDLIAPLERQLGKPVVTANQAGIWAALRALGRPAIGPGQTLLAGRPA
ncbi:maleate cis-trans isomerase family protein [Amycolatopsis nigrescens]|uniref:maleate cis-trans isomerase family protein n=1 Tax=Amycolatopsis nigrescens TaxID=381445 RepID=UPI00036DE5B1|nr:hypothetical protein [Amycolatopsis nigrescens]